MNKIAKCPCGYPLDEKGLCICCIDEILLADCEWFLEHNPEVILNVDDYNWLLHKAREGIRLARENAKLKEKNEEMRQQVINKEEECKICQGDLFGRYNKII